MEREFSEAELEERITVHYLFNRGIDFLRISLEKGHAIDWAYDQGALVLKVWDSAENCDDGRPAQHSIVTPDEYNAATCGSFKKNTGFNDHWGSKLTMTERTAVQMKLHRIFYT